jgi:hypothetical protein
MSKKVFLRSQRGPGNFRPFNFVVFDSEGQAIVKKTIKNPNFWEVDIVIGRLYNREPIEINTISPGTVVSRAEIQSVEGDVTALNMEINQKVGKRFVIKPHGINVKFL